MHDAKQAERDSVRGVSRGAAVNMVGIAARTLHPLFLVLATRLYGPAAVGIYLVAAQFVDIVQNVSVGGFKDGVVMYVARYRDAPETEGEVYRIVANAVVVVLSVGLLAIGIVLVGGNLLLHTRGDPELASALLPLAFTIPFYGLAEVAIAATRARLIMTYDALINGAVIPAVMTVAVVIFWWLDMGLAGLVLARVLGILVGLVLALAAYSRHFELSRTVTALRGLKFHRELLKFSLPQSLNLTFNQLIMRVDVVMLGMFGVAAPLIAFYGTAADIILNIRHVKLAFSGAYAPLLARLHYQGRHRELEHSYSDVLRWTTALVIPIALAVAVFRSELLLLFHPSYTHDNTFMLLLLSTPLFAATIGLAGNVVVMTGHSWYNLFNSFWVALANIVANYFWIPTYGLLGAAWATLLASSSLVLLENLEVWFLVGLRPDPRRLYRPYLAAAITALICAPLWLLDLPPLAAHTLQVSAFVGVYLLAAVRLDVDPISTVAARLFRGRPSELG
ncbi:MAG: oligosaccharide flippase family protein [Myxococcota bacterium]